MKLNPIKRFDSAKKSSLMGYGTFLMVTLILFWRCFYGICNSDEGFYYAITHRIFMGDALLADEWYPAQLFAFIILPFYKLFYFITGDGEGIILYFRLICLLFKVSVALLFYNRMKAKSHRNFAALIASLLFLLYERDNLLSMSYYYIGMLLTFVFGFVIYLADNADDSKKRKWLYFLSGICFAFATLANPYLALVYCVILIWYIISFCYKKITAKDALASVGGVFFVVVIFCGFVFRRANPKQILDNVTYIFNDPSHPPKNMVYEFFRWFWIIIKEYGWISILCLTGMVIYILFSNYRKKELSISSKRNIFILNIIVFVCNVINSMEQVGLVLVAVSFMGLICFLLTKRKDIPLFINLFCLGIGVSIAYSFASDTGIVAVIIGFSLAAPAAVLFMADCWNELMEEGILRYKKGKWIITVVCFLVPVMIMLSMRIAYVWRDDPISQLKYQTESGPYKYIYTGQWKNESNGILLNDLEYINSLVSSEDKVFITRFLPWGYCCIDCQVGSYTVWRVDFDSERQNVYYSLDENRIPNYIFVVDKSFGRYNYENTLEGELWDTIVSEGYEHEELESGVLYYKNRQK